MREGVELEVKSLSDMLQANYSSRYVDEGEEGLGPSKAIRHGNKRKKNGFPRLVSCLLLVLEEFSLNNARLGRVD